MDLNNIEKLEIIDDLLNDYWSNAYRKHAGEIQGHENGQEIATFLGFSEAYLRAIDCGQKASRSSLQTVPREPREFTLLEIVQDQSLRWQRSMKEESAPFRAWKFKAIRLTCGDTRSNNYRGGSKCKEKN